MNLKKCSWLLGMALLLGSVVSYAGEGEKASRPAKKEDLAGVWDMVAVKPVLDKTDAVFYPFQRFVFNKDSSMKFMVSEKPFTKEWLDKFQKQSSEIDYSLDARGLLTLTWQSRPHNEMAVCAYVLMDVPPNVLAKLPASERGRVPKKGNITLSYLNNQGKISYQKIFMRTA